MKAPGVAIAAGLASIAVALAIHWQGANPTTVAAPVPVVDRGALPASSPARPGPSSADVPSTRTTAHHVVRRGTHLRLTRLGVDAPVVPVRVVDHVMQIPLDPHVLGWWRAGAGPGDPAGTVVVVGQINYAGATGALAVLPDARPGDVVTLARQTYRVAAVRTYAKTSGIPMSAFRTTGSPQLVLITCGGPFDAGTGNYEDNIVVYATPA